MPRTSTPTAEGLPSRQSTQTSGSLLLSPSDAALSLDYDQYQRYAMAARLLDRLLAGASQPVQVLEIGCNVLNLWPMFLDPQRVRVTRCDVERYADDPDFVVIEPGRPLPFPSDSFAAVVALEVLEHIPEVGRRAFVGECLRVAREGVVLSCPNGTPEVKQAEAIAAASYQKRNGRPHPFLKEHHEFGLPREEDVVTLLRELDRPHAVFDNAPLDAWLATMLVSEILQEREDGPHLRRRVNRPFVEGQPSGKGIAYRKFYVIAKTFAATSALEPLANRATSDREALQGAPAALHRLAMAATDALLRLDSDWRAERETANAELQERQAEIDRLEHELKLQREGTRQERQRSLGLLVLLQGMRGSVSWRWTAWLRGLRRLLRPGAGERCEPLPLRHIEREAGPGNWRATNDTVELLVPCLLPAGWARLRLHLKAAGATRLSVHSGGDGLRQPRCLARIAVQDPEQVELFLHVTHPLHALRLQLTGAPEQFRLADVCVEPLSAVTAAWHALRTWGSMRGVTTLLVLLVRGRFREMAQLLYRPLRRHAPATPLEHDSDTAYEAWRRRHALSDADRARIRTEIAALTDPPVISVLLPVHNVAEPYLREAIDSVRRQLYPHWQLCIADDGSTAPHVRRVLDEQARLDRRIQVTYLPSNRGISAASNAALELATGDYVALLDHDDMLAEHALYRMAQAIVADRTLDMVYSDEDKLEPDGWHCDPFFKPDWSPDYFLSCMYTCHLGVYRTGLVRDVGGFRSEFDLAQDYDLVLRLAARGARVGHVPDVLYHWRKLESSTASGAQAKPRAHDAARRALEAYLAAIGRPGRVEPGPTEGFHRVRWTITGRPRISIVIPTGCRHVRLRGRDTTYLAACVESIRRKSTYANYEIVAVDNNDMPAELRHEMDRWNVRTLSFTSEFNLAAKINLGAAHATGDYLLLLNDDIEVITPDWLESMLEYAQLPEIGAVGAKLLFPDGRIQHAGVTILDGNPGHPFYGHVGEHPGHFCSNIAVRNWIAVTGACLMTRTALFRDLGGFRADLFPLNYNDVDFCLRLDERGLRIVNMPYARLYHHEAVTKSGVYAHELETFHATWGVKRARDPYYNPNLTMRYCDFRVSDESDGHG